MYANKGELTRRQRQTLVGISMGLTYRQIAMQLGNHEQTIKIIAESLRERYEAHTQAQIVIGALKRQDLGLGEL